MPLRTSSGPWSETVLPSSTFPIRVIAPVVKSMASSSENRTEHQHPAQATHAHREHADEPDSRSTPQAEQSAKRATGGSLVGNLYAQTATKATQRVRRRRGATSNSACFSRRGD